MIEGFYLLRKQAVADMLVVFATAMAIASLVIQQYNDGDVWWHIAIGRDIISNNSVPLTDYLTAAGWGRAYQCSRPYYYAFLS